MVDYTERATCPIFGDGAAAFMVEPTTEDLGIMDAILRTDGKGLPFLHMKAGGSVCPPSYFTVDNKMHYIHHAYSISINDSTTYSSTKEKNKAVNAELAEILTVLKNNGETLNNDFKIDRKKDGTYSFNVSGSSLNRFRADVFGKGSADDLEYDKETGIDEANATAEQIMEYLMGKDNFGISSKYDGDLAYRIVVVRYAMLGNRFARYKEVKIATDVSDKTVAYVNEHMDTLSGISVNEDMIRKYNYSEYFSSIIGYTGPISESEYTALHKKNKDYTQNDTVGKAGLEQYYETYLRGKNGEQKFYIDNVGRISEIINIKFLLSVFPRR